MRKLINTLVMMMMIFAKTNEKIDKHTSDGDSYKTNEKIDKYSACDDICNSHELNDKHSSDDDGSREEGKGKVLQKY